jgi:soluble lytic murein transglycosylase-like protein
MQLMPDTAQWVGDGMLREAPALRDPRWNARAGTRLLAFYLSRYGGDKATALAAYFQGMTSVDQTGIHASSRTYIASILRLETIFSR